MASIGVVLRRSVVHSESIGMLAVRGMTKGKKKVSAPLRANCALPILQEFPHIIRLFRMLANESHNLLVCIQ